MRLLEDMVTFHLMMSSLGNANLIHLKQRTAWSNRTYTLDAASSTVEQSRLDLRPSEAKLEVELVQMSPISLVRRLRCCRTSSLSSIITIERTLNVSGATSSPRLADNYDTGSGSGRYRRPE